jgi:hypothetical protein
MRCSRWLACSILSGTLVGLALGLPATADVLEETRAFVKEISKSKRVVVGTRTCLFLDDRFIAEQSGLKRTWHQGKPNPEAAIAPTRPWEKWPHLFGSVLYDPKTKLYRMWYTDVPVWTDRGCVFYAESVDARTWKKPELGLVEIKGSSANNCLFSNAELPNVFLDPNETNPRARFKMLVWRGRFSYKGKTISGHVLYSSEDGIHWDFVGAIDGPEQPEESYPRQVHDTNQIIWDPLAARYLGDYRTFVPHPGRPGWVRELWTPKRPKEIVLSRDGYRRAVGISTSKELLSGWSPIQMALQADGLDDSRVKALGRGPEPDWAELYAMPMFVYGNHYLGMVTLLQLIDSKDTVVGSGDLQLTFSHDGKKWYRHPDRQSLIARSPARLTPVFAACNEPLDMGDEIWIFYTEATGTHAEEGSPAYVRAARWRKDGFVSLDCSDRGSLTTVPLVLDGQELRVNFRAREGGSLRVAILDDQGRPIAGLSTDDCDPFSGDAVAHTTTWHKKAGLSGLAGKPIRLRFELARGQLWSFRFGN